MTSRVQSETVAGSGTRAYTYAVSTDPTKGYNYPDGINTWSVEQTSVNSDGQAGTLNYNGDESTYWPAAGGIAVGGVPANSYTMTDEDASGTDQAALLPLGFRARS